MKLKPFKAHIPNLKKIESLDSFFSSVSENYLDKYASKKFIPQDEESIFVYKISSPTGTYHGLIATNDVEDIKEGNIVPHETTLSFKENRLKELLNRRQAQIKPILCAFECPQSIMDFMNQITTSQDAFLTINLEWTNEVHQLWQINRREDINLLVSSFSQDVPEVFIADGHHRVTSILQLNEENRQSQLPSPDGLLTVYIPFRELKIFDYNRILTREEHYEREWVIKRLNEAGDLHKMTDDLYPPTPGTIQVCIGVTWYELIWHKTSIDDDIRELDVDLFNQFIVMEALDIGDTERKHRITYIPGIHGREGLMRAMAASNYSLGFMFPPISKEQLKMRARSGHPLPPKSTWFEPRIKNGLVVYPYID
ncbi:MAG: DUF1015 domain-containing protein [Saprospiraceae bacterium]|nr:DUF1015 domain-containing protein [Saprospiraceae bacterium]